MFLSFSFPPISRHHPQELRGVMKLQYSMDHGVVTNWADMERIWQHMYSAELKVNPEEVRACACMHVCPLCTVLPI